MSYTMFSQKVLLSGDGDEFLGRRKELAYLREKALAETPRHISVHGMPHIGKSVLLRKLMEELQEEEDCCVLYYTLGTQGFVSDMVEILMPGLYTSLPDEYADREELAPILAELLQISTETATAESCLSLLERFLAATTSLGLRVVFLLDEFEHINNTTAILRNPENTFVLPWAEEDYLGFAKILMNDSYSFVCITASRPRMEENLSAYERIVNPFTSVLLRGFDAEDMEEYFNCLYASGLSPLFSREKQSLLRYCGRRPLLLSLMGNRLLNAPKGTTVDMLYSTMRTEDFRLHFEDSTSFMKIEELRKKRSFSHIVKCYFGASADYQDILEQCIDLGYIDLLDEDENYTYTGGDFYYTDETGKYGEAGKRYVYVTVSHAFVDYLYTNELDNIHDTRDLLTGFIYTLRDITKKEMVKKYPNQNWNEVLLFKLCGRNWRYIMKSRELGGRYVMWWQEDGHWWYSDSRERPKEKPTESLFREAQVYYSQNRKDRNAMITPISDASFSFLLSEFNSDLTGQDMPLLDVINLMENGAIIFHYSNLFAGYFGCFGTGFDKPAQDKLSECLAELVKKRNKISHFSRTGLSEDEKKRTKELCRALLKSIYTYISTNKAAAPMELFQ